MPKTEREREREKERDRDTQKERKTERARKIQREKEFVRSLRFIILGLLKDVYDWSIIRKIVLIGAAIAQLA